jgi:hypothetical protein
MDFRTSISTSRHRKYSYSGSAEAAIYSTDLDHAARGSRGTHGITQALNLLHMACNSGDPLSINTYTLQGSKSAFCLNEFNAPYNQDSYPWLATMQTATSY